MKRKLTIIGSLAAVGCICLFSGCRAGKTDTEIAAYLHGINDGVDVCIDAMDNRHMMTMSRVDQVNVVSNALNAKIAAFVGEARSKRIMETGR